MACCLLVALIVARVRRLLGLGGAAPSRGPSLVALLGVAAAELGVAWAIARGLTTEEGMSSPGGMTHDLDGHPSHLLVMAQLTALGIVVPLVLAWLLPARDRGPRPWARRELVVATVAAPAVMWFWHLPGEHDNLAAHGWLQVLPAVSVLVTGVVFWRLVLGAGRRVAPPGARQIALVVAGQATALLGLALLLTSDPLHGGPEGLWGLSAVADQRLAGVLMLVVDLGVMLPLLAALNDARRASTPRIQLRMPPERTGDEPTAARSM